MRLRCSCSSRSGTRCRRTCQDRPSFCTQPRKKCTRFGRRCSRLRNFRGSMHGRPGQPGWSMPSRAAAAARSWSRQQNGAPGLEVPVCACVRPRARPGCRLSFSLSAKEMVIYGSIVVTCFVSLLVSCPFCASARPCMHAQLSIKTTSSGRLSSSQRCSTLDRRHEPSSQPHVTEPGEADDVSAFQGHR